MAFFPGRCRPSGGMESDDASSLPDTEIRLIAYRCAARISPLAWEPSEVKGQMSPIVKFLEDATDRDDFALRVAILEEQIINLGLHPVNHSPSQIKTPPDPATSYRKAAPLPDAPDLVEAARKIYRILTQT